MRFRDFHPNVRIRILLQFVTNTTSNMIIPFMPIYLASRFGMGTTGTLLLVNLILGISCGMIGGYLADRIGRKRMMLTAECLIFAAYAMMAATNSAWWRSSGITIFMLSVISIAWGFAKPATEAMLLDVTTPETRKTMYGITYWSNNLSIAIASMVGAYLFRSHLDALFLVMSGITLASFATIWLMITDEYVPVSREPRPRAPVGAGFWHNYRSVLGDRLFMWYVIGSLLLISVEMHLANYIGVRLAREMPATTLFVWGHAHWRMDGIQMLGFLRTENTVAVVLLALVVRRLAGRYKDWKVMAAGCLIYVIGNAYLGFSNQPWGLVLAILAVTLGELMYVPIKQAFLGSLAPEQARSSYMAVNSLTVRGAMMIGAAGVSLGTVLPPSAMAGMIAACGLVGTGILLWLFPQLEAKQASSKGGQMRISAKQGLSSRQSG